MRSSLWPGEHMMVPKAIQNWWVCPAHRRVTQPFLLSWVKIHYTCTPNNSTLISEVLALKSPQNAIAPWKYNWTFNKLLLSSSVLTTERTESADCLFSLLLFIISKYLFLRPLLEVMHLSGRVKVGVTVLLPSIGHTNDIYFQPRFKLCHPCTYGSLS